jgi:hypothetical protein
MRVHGRLEGPCSVGEIKTPAPGKPQSRQLPRLLPSFSLAPALKFFHNPLHEVKRMAQGFP